jgi:hypothetical protein
MDRLKALAMGVLLAVGAGACEGETRKVTTYQTDGTGRPDWSTAKDVMMDPLAEIEMRRQGLHDGLAYSGDCKVTTGGDDNAYSKEFVVKESGNFTWSECSYFGAGSSALLALSFDDLLSRYYPVGRSINNNVKFGKARSGSDASYRIVVHQNETFGGGYSMQHETVAANTEVQWAEPGQATPVGSSAIMCRLPNCQ